MTPRSPLPAALTAPAVPRRSTAPTLRFVNRLASSYGPLVAGCDEVGRGALAGPVSVGVVVVDARTVVTRTVLRDSKLLTPERRVELVPLIRRWAVGAAVGHASAEEIDEVGIMEALRLAGLRALEQIAADGVVPDAVHLDGNYDWLTRGGQGSLFDGPPRTPIAPVTTTIKADLSCQAVAAASIVAKVERDSLMVGYGTEDPRFGWAVNKGYATPEHRAAILEHGPTPLHRRSWHLATAGELEG
ncbi:ribonuclease HII [Sinomonas cellulolyticus]|uniref:Ribonuclease n=1 Tax=Sinomonas cellulolyticus TaxID=2801916 RepID=A0ABS1K4C0_9MICC|nr:ribonuclease HII [Sinomonas cellulolyticus]GHG44299.1 ribonuclease HII [Sinomonas sp. KCTC 49339]